MMMNDDGGGKNYRKFVDVICERPLRVTAGRLNYHFHFIGKNLNSEKVRVMKKLIRKTRIRTCIHSIVSEMLQQKIRKDILILA